MTMSVAIIINPIAGGAAAAGRGARWNWRAVSRQRAARSADVFVTERPGHARELARATREAARGSSWRGAATAR